MTILLVASERPKYETKDGPAGSQGRVLDRMLTHAGIARSDVKVIQVGQWQDMMADEFDCVVLGGEAAATMVLGWKAPPSDWHGSVLPCEPLPPNGWESYRSWLIEAPKYVVTHDIAKLTAVWEWHPLAAADWRKVGAIARGEYALPAIDRYEWVVNSPHRFGDIVDRDEGATLAFDTELSPVWMFGAATDRQVHVMDWSHDAARYVPPVMQRDDVMKVAHNLQHDLAMCELRFGFKVTRPYFDTYGGCTLLNTALERSLSPGLASRFTNYPFHKWLTNYDAMHYNGMDNIVCYEGYYKIRAELEQRELWAVAEHDHDLLEVLYEMQRTGFRIDEVQRAAYEAETTTELAAADSAVAIIAEPVIRTRWQGFEKPHLFRRMRQCECCGGGKVTALHCWRCDGLPVKPKKKADYLRCCGASDMPSTVAELRAALPPCSVCQASGKVLQWLPFNPDSPDQVADVLYRGLRIPARKYKGKETTAAAQLKPLADRHPLVAAVVAASEIRANLDTVKRLSPGTDGRLHCVFDPWGTESGRVASKEGLLEPGTNAMNIPKKARRFVVPG